MKKNLIITILFYIAAFCFYIIAVVNFFGESNSMGATYFCLGSTMLCLGSVYLSKFKKEDHEDKDE